MKNIMKNINYNNEIIIEIIPNTKNINYNKILDVEIKPNETDTNKITDIKTNNIKPNNIKPSKVIKRKKNINTEKLYNRPNIIKQSNIKKKNVKKVIVNIDNNKSNNNTPNIKKNINTDKLCIKSTNINTDKLCIKSTNINTDKLCIKSTNINTINKSKLNIIPTNKNKNKNKNKLCSKPNNIKKSPNNKVNVDKNKSNIPPNKIEVINTYKNINSNNKIINLNLLKKNIKHLNINNDNNKKINKVNINTINSDNNKPTNINSDDKILNVKHEIKSINTDKIETKIIYNNLNVKSLLSKNIKPPHIQESKETSIINKIEHPQIKSNIITQYNYIKCLSRRNFNLNETRKSINTTINPNKEKFRVICSDYINYIRHINLPNITLDNDNEAVLIEYRCLPHLEFLIRNAIIKLGNEWSHTIICGDLNYSFITNICKSISINIKIIKTDYNNLNQTTYSIFLADKKFWELLTGNKILIYQEDSCIFNSNIKDFLNWDYIGAPWKVNQNDTLNSVGNGGFSLRSKITMIKVIDHVSIFDTKINSSTENYMNCNKMTICPEDVYFSKNIQDFNLGIVANYNSALLFSTETINNSNSFGGHCFWLSDNNWEERILTKTIITFKLHSKIRTEHRGGWNTIIDSLFKYNIFNNISSYLFLDMIERYFIWSNNKEITNIWSGIIHCTPITPTYLNSFNISLLFNNKYFLNSLDKCLCLFTLSQYITDYLNKEFLKINKNIKIFTLKHPIEMINIKQFDINKYVNNPCKKLIQLGQQLRKCTSIYLLNNLNHERIWLTGTMNINKCNILLKNEILFLKLNPKILNSKVKMYYTETIEEYDNLLTNNIVFIDLFDAAANNAVIECIIRNTPIIINKLDAVVEYLGEDYPLYFNNLNEINDLLDIKNILKSYEYLKKMDKTFLNMDVFINNMINNLSSLRQ